MRFQGVCRPAGQSSGTPPSLLSPTPQDRERLASFDVSDLGRIREVSRLTVDDKQKPHWVSATEDGRARRGVLPRTRL